MIRYNLFSNYRLINFKGYSNILLLAYQINILMKQFILFLYSDSWFKSLNTNLQVKSYITLNFTYFWNLLYQFNIIYINKSKWHIYTIRLARVLTWFRHGTCNYTSCLCVRMMCFKSRIMWWIHWVRHDTTQYCTSKCLTSTYQV